MVLLVNLSKSISDDVKGLICMFWDNKEIICQGKVDDKSFCVIKGFYFHGDK